nr:Rnase Y domain-containing protein [Smithellaceae bacterium]
MLNGGLFVLVIFGAIVAGIIVGYILKQLFSAKKVESSESLAARIIEEAKKESETIKKEAVLQVKENLLKIKADFDRENKDRRNELDALEKRIRSKEENLDKRIDSLAHKEANIDSRERAIA